MNPLHANHYSHSLILAQLVLLTGEKPKLFQDCSVEELAAKRDELFAELDSLCDSVNKKCLEQHGQTFCEMMDEADHP